MNTSVQAGAFIVSLKAETLNARVVTTMNIVTSIRSFPATRSCLALSIISINGHSLSSVNPDSMIGGKATLIAA